MHEWEGSEGREKTRSVCRGGRSLEQRCATRWQEMPKGNPMVAVVMERRIRYDVEGYLMLLAGHLEMTVGTGKNPR